MMLMITLGIMNNLKRINYEFFDIKKEYAMIFCPSRLSWYDNLLMKVSNRVHLFHTIEEFYKKQVNSKYVVQNEKHFIIRHDVDTDLKTAYYFYLRKSIL